MKEDIKDIAIGLLVITNIATICAQIKVRHEIQSIHLQAALGASEFGFLEAQKGISLDKTRTEWEDFVREENIKNSLQTAN